MGIQKLFVQIFVGLGLRHRTSSPQEQHIQVRIPEPQHTEVATLPLITQPQLRISNTNEAMPAIEAETVEAIPAFNFQDINGLSPQQTAAFLLTIYGEDFLERIEIASASEIKAINLLFRLEESGSVQSFREIATGIPDGQTLNGRYSNLHYLIREYSPVMSQPTKDIERLLIEHGVEEGLALQTGKQLTGDQVYKQAFTTDDKPTILSMVGKVKLSKAQSTIKTLFIRITSLSGDTSREDLTHEVTQFLGLPTNNAIVSRLQRDDLDSRVKFLEILAQRTPRYVHGNKSTLDNEWIAYQKYEKAHKQFKPIAEGFLNAFNDFNINNFHRRNNIVDFLENRTAANDTAALDFIDELFVLKNQYNVEGTHRLFDKAFKYINNGNGNQIYGLYYEASVALSLASNTRNNIKVHALSVEEVSLGDNQIIHVDDIDILASKGDQLCDIEVKTSINAAYDEQEQITTNVRNARRHDSIPVLLPGNINPIINVTDKFVTRKQLRQMILDEPKQISLVEQAVKAEELISAPSNKGLQLWDESGNEHQDEVCRLALDYQQIRTAA